MIHSLWPFNGLAGNWKPLTVTPEIAGAINAYTGKPVIGDRDIGLSMYSTYSSDFGYGMIIMSDDTRFGENYRKLISLDGHVSAGCFRESCVLAGEAKEPDDITSHQATVLYGALFGLAGLDEIPTHDLTTEISTLKKTYGL